jgi:hypothetical protein
MCLHIDVRNHVAGPTDKSADVNKSFKVAPRPILVHKVLVHTTAKTGRSPYFQFRYNFGKLYKSAIGKALQGSYSKGWNIGKGLHSFYKKTAPRANNFSQNNIYPAIIPAGAKFFMGSGDEIVSDQLIVYKTMQDLEAVHGKVDYRNPIRSITV